MLFILSLNPFLLSRYLNFVLIFGDIRRHIGLIAKFNFKNYDIIIWETNNYNTQVAQYLKK